MRYPVFIVTPGSKVGFENGTLRVTLSGEDTQLRFPIRRVLSLCVFGPMSFSPHVLEHLLRLGISVQIFSASGRYVGWLCPPQVLIQRSANVIFKLATKIETQLYFGTKMLHEKILGMRKLTEAIAKNADEPTTSITLRRIERLDFYLDRALKPGESISTLRGIEGALTKEHYQIFQLGIRNNRSIFSFPSRSRRPPLDPCNALLSFLYTLLLGEGLCSLSQVGLPTATGFLHSDISTKQPALALDFIEPYRSTVAERLALRFINLAQVNETHFEKSRGGVFLTQEGRRIVTQEWQSQLSKVRSNGTTYRHNICANAIQLKRDLEEAYEKLGATL